MSLSERFCFISVEAVQSQMHLFTDVPPSTPHSAARSDSSQAKEYERRLSNMSISSQVSGHWDYTLASVSAGKHILKRMFQKIVFLLEFQKKTL